MDWERLLPLASKTLIEAMSASRPESYLEHPYSEELRGRLDYSGAPDWEVRLEAASSVMAGFIEFLKIGTESNKEEEGKCDESA